MAWTNISNALVSVGALPFATTIQALRDNPIAIANGDVGAPQIQTAAIADNAITPAKIPASTVGDRNVALGLGAVGTYAMLKLVRGGTNDTVNAAGTTATGSELQYANAAGISSGSPSGTWRLHGVATSGVTSPPANSPERVSMWLRIS
jgi:hypothetical protein